MTNKINDLNNRARQHSTILSNLEKKLDEIKQNTKKKIQSLELELEKQENKILYLNESEEKKLNKLIRSNSKVYIYCQQCKTFYSKNKLKEKLEVKRESIPGAPDEPNETVYNNYYITYCSRRHELYKRRV